MPPPTDTLEFVPAVSSRFRSGAVPAAGTARGVVRLGPPAVSPVLVLLEAPSSRRHPPAGPARLASILVFSPEPPPDAA